MNNDRTILITDLVLELEPTGAKKAPFAPIVQAGVLRVSTHAFRHIVSHVLTDEIDIPVGRLAFVDCGWQAGGAWVTMRVRSFIQQNVTLKASLLAAGNGNLQIKLFDVRAGMLPLNRLLDPLVDQIARQPGFIRTGTIEVELNIADLLRARNVPLNFVAQVRNVRIDDDMLTLEMGS